MGQLFFLSSLGTRLPLVASVATHVAIFAAAATAGHGKGAARAPVEERSIEIEAPTEAPTFSEPPLAPEAPARADHRTYSTHSHPYPLPPNHDDIPHDPSIDHRHPAAAAPAALASAAPALPTFSMVLGASDMTAASIAGTSAREGQAQVSPKQASGADAEEDELTVSVPARLVSNVQPEYPSSARAAGVEADVTLEIVVDSTGRVAESRLLRRAGHGFDESALRAIRNARFTPAQHEGAPVRVRMPWTVSFRLE